MTRSSLIATSRLLSTVKSSAVRNASEGSGMDTSFSIGSFSRQSRPCRARRADHSGSHLRGGRGQTAL